MSDTKKEYGLRVMNQTRQIKISKYLSKHLRHTPERIGLTLAIGGWVSVDELLSACATHQFPLTHAELEEVVAVSDKRRFSESDRPLLLAWFTAFAAEMGEAIAVFYLRIWQILPPITSTRRSAIVLSVTGTTTHSSRRNSLKLK